jgi:hypothetical protein
MVKSSRLRVREARKQKALALFSENETLLVNQVAAKMGMGWPVASRLLEYLVEDGKLVGNTRMGYRLPRAQQAHNLSLLDRIKRILSV